MCVIIIIYGNKQDFTFSPSFSHANLCYMLATEHLWWLLMTASLLETHRKYTCQRFSLSFHHTALPHIKHFHSGQCGHCMIRKTLL